MWPLPGFPGVAEGAGATRLLAADAGQASGVPGELGNLATR